MCVKSSNTTLWQQKTYAARAQTVIQRVMITSSLRCSLGSQCHECYQVNMTSTGLQSQTLLCVVIHRSFMCCNVYVVIYSFIEITLILGTYACVLRRPASSCLFTKMMSYSMRHLFIVTYLLFERNSTCHLFIVRYLFSVLNETAF